MPGGKRNKNAGGAAAGDKNKKKEDARLEAVAEKTRLANAEVIELQRKLAQSNQRAEIAERAAAALEGGEGLRVAQREVAESRHEVAELQHENTRLKAELAAPSEESEEIIRVRRENAALQDEIQRLRDAMRTTEVKAQEAQAQVTTLTEQVEFLQGIIATKIAENKQLEDRLESQHREIIGKDNGVANLARQIQAVTAERDAALDELHALRARIENGDVGSEYTGSVHERTDDSVTPVPPGSDRSLSEEGAPATSGIDMGVLAASLEAAAAAQSHGGNLSPEPVDESKTAEPVSGSGRSSPDSWVDAGNDSKSQTPSAEGSGHTSPVPRASSPGK